MDGVRKVGEFAKGKGKRIGIMESAPFGGVHEGVWGEWFEPVLNFVEVRGSEGSER